MKTAKAATVKALQQQIQSKQMSSPFWFVLNCRLRLLQARRADGSTNCWPMHSHHLHCVGLVPEQRVQIPSNLHFSSTSFLRFSDSKGFAAQSQLSQLSQLHLWVSKGWSIQPPTKERRRWGGVRVSTDFLLRGHVRTVFEANWYACF